MDISVDQGVDISVDFVAYDITVFVFFLDFETSTLPIDSSDQKAAAQALGLYPLREQFCGAGQPRFCLVDSEPCQMRRIVQNA